MFRGFLQKCAHSGGSNNDVGYYLFVFVLPIPFDADLGRRWEQVEGHQSAFQFLMFEVSSSIIVIYTSYDKVIKNQHAASFKPMFLAVGAILGKVCAIASVRRSRVRV
ncbi:hypothetical protein RRG08_020542 [Elysia crispata]|uniref:Uncharacterized protein n=1 Tax=Elysia crispata TaxID=231223 RepID=A0AAE1AKP1_9GAST|nr:hypothetical protein RRG08_020542 [Elysia crispata]